MKPFFRTFMLTAGLVLQSTLITLPVSAQSLPLRRFTVEDGLPHSNVFRVFQDSKGYVWMGTELGLCRFDGHGFDRFEEYRLLADRSILGFAESEDGTIWVNSYDGRLHCFDGECFREYQPRAGIIDYKVTGLVTGATGRLWMLSNNSVRYLRQDTSHQFLFESYVKNLHADIGRLQPRIMDIIDDVPDTLIFATGKGVIVQSNGTEHHIFTRETGAESVHTVTKDSRGNFWLGMIGKITCIAPDGKVRCFQDRRIRGKKVQQIEEGPEGQTWIRGEGIGPSRIDGDSVVHLAASLGLNNVQVNDLMFDRDGNVWLATYGSGVMCMFNSSTLVYSTEHGLPNNYIHQVTEDRKGKIWVRTFSGLCTIDSNGVRRRKLGIGSSSGAPALIERVESMCVDSAGIVWAGVKPNHVVQIDSSVRHLGSYVWRNDRLSDIVRERRRPEPNYLKRTLPFLLYTDSDGTVFASFWRGLQTFAGSEVRSWDSILSLYGHRVYSLFRDCANVLWIGTDGGILRFRNGEAFTYTEAEGLPGRKVTGICEDHEGGIWISTSGGVACFRKGRWQAFGENDGLGHPVCTAIAADSGGTIWVGTLAGLHFFDGQRFNKYSRFYGLASNEIVCLYVDGREKLWVGTVRGVVMLTPYSDVRTRGPAPEVYIRRVDCHDFKYYAPRFIELPHDSASFTIHFSSIAFAISEEIEFQHKMENVDNDWQTGSAWRREFTGLGPGRYLFRLRARRAGTGWSGEPAVLAIHIVPPFWQSWWFIAISGIAGILLVFQAHRLRSSILQQRRLREMQLQQKVKNLEQQALNLSMNPHFLFNALTSIQYFFNERESLASTNIYLSKFARLIRLVLNDAQKETITLAEELERLRLYLELERMRLGQRLRWSIKLDEELDADEIIIPVMIIQPFVENAIWHGITPLKDTGRVSVEVTLSADDVLRIVILDDGIGVESSRRHAAKPPGHVSQGLRIVKERIEFLKQSGKFPAGLTINEADPNNSIRPGTRVELWLQV